MKYLMVAWFLVAALINRGQCMSDAEKDMYYERYKKCQETSGVSDDMLEGTKYGNFPDDSAFKEHLLCVLKVSGAQGEDGFLNLEVFERYLEKGVPDLELRAEVRNDCSQRKATPQDTALHFTKCLFGYSDKIGLDMD